MEYSMEEIEKRFDKIEDKLDQITKILITQESHTIRLANLEAEIKEMKDDKKAWVQPVISTIISAIVAFIVGGGLKIF